ncbi:isoamyl acetate-hydrolyzing esterase [Coemansia sp. Benny D160-2]|nr:isoamyl acetate-hydrolyzing esterase [Coemansia sp. Benny D160-2]
MYDVTLAFGDSITQLGYEHDNSGWVTHLSNRYVRNMDVLNRGFSAFSTRRAKDIAHVVFPVRKGAYANGSPVDGSSGWFGWLTNGARNIKQKVFKDDSLATNSWPENKRPFPARRSKVQLCILFFGANDAADPRDYRHIPLAEYSLNLRYLINMLRNPESMYYAPETRILIITPPAVGDKMSKETFMKYGWTYGPHKNVVTKKYAEAAVDVAKDLDMPYIDIWTAIESRVQESRKHLAAEPSLESRKDNGYDGYDEFLIDGLHLNSKGNELLYSLLVETIDKNWPELHPRHVTTSDYYE